LIDELFGVRIGAARHRRGRLRTDAHAMLDAIGMAGFTERARRELAPRA
jgi:hypothetical protein